MSGTNWTATGCGLSVLPTGYILSKNSESNSRINWTVEQVIQPSIKVFFSFINASNEQNMNIGSEPKRIFFQASLL